MATKTEMENIIKKLKDEIRELRKEVKNQDKAEMPEDNFFVYKDGKEFILAEVKFNKETDDIEIINKKQIKAVHMAMYEAKKRLAYIINN